MHMFTNAIVYKRAKPGFVTRFPQAGHRRIPFSLPSQLLVGHTLGFGRGFEDLQPGGITTIGCITCIANCFSLLPIASEFQSFYLADMQDWFRLKVTMRPLS
uniref:Uncharacterized protein n=1 Tax=Physcomitrium patens TaxID=3218 RepID=A0A2K1L9J4_PHYPA|nr:hypothetical protein PHYPA_001095 [Physcomitrium patens]